MSAVPEFQQYQLAFTAHIRQPDLHRKPAKVPNNRMAVYRNAIFNNFLSIFSACFPVTQQVMGARAWKKMVKRFIAEHAASTPIFRDIPFEFVKFLAGLDDLPAHLQALTHYEWVELAVAHQPVDNTVATMTLKDSATLNLLDEIPQFAAHQLLAYDYPVHMISKKNIPDTSTPTYLLVFRNQTFDVKFIALNPVTFRLLSLLKVEPRTGRQALTLLAQELQQAPDSIMQFGEGILHDLAAQQVLIGAINSR